VGKGGELLEEAEEVGASGVMMGAEDPRTEIRRVPTHTSPNTSPTLIRASVAGIPAPPRPPSASAAARGLHRARPPWGAACSHAEPLLPQACVVPGTRSSPWSSAYHLDPRRCARLDPPPQPISLRRCSGSGREELKGNKMGNEIDGG
jgi:hypothetical protein